MARLVALLLAAAAGTAFVAPLARPAAVAPKAAARARAPAGSAGAWGVGTLGSLAVCAAVARRAAITDKVSFDNIAREWRCKWSADNDKASLDAAQEALDSVLAEVKKVDGVQSVQRVVCGGCLDFKVVVKLPADKFGSWEEAKFEPEESFLKQLKGIDGISTVETQTYTLEEV
ncbi:unnamed protein product [Effrenium voratum]|uniref:Uncharacterized protein n=1 Tax=Effrenium voratum TaxID=2562239 RepID=A0AA36IZE2_9DINO|nr:unnamed protein product [Effrenium voratum]